MTVAEWFYKKLFGHCFCRKGEGGVEQKFEKMLTENGKCNRINEKRGEVMELERSCCFTGHRPDRLPWGEEENDLRCQAVKEQMFQAIEQLYEAGVRHFISGMARGSDLYFAEAVLALREQRSDITLECARPCESQANRWPNRERERYEAILNCCNYETLVQHRYDRGCMMRRNRYMVDHSSWVLAVYDGIPKGGTAQTLAYAMKQRKKIRMIPVE